MKSRHVQPIQLVVILIGTSLFLTNCKNPPIPAFTYEPQNNPEVGDTIKFTNLSTEAVSYSWDFGNGEISEEENPYTIYETTGAREVTLTATNEDGSESVSDTISVNEPTIMAFFVYRSSDTTILSDCEIWVFDNEADFENFNEPQFIDYTDDDGIAVFMNMEPQVYYVIAYKEAEGGIWLAGGRTASLEQNSTVAYEIICEFYPDEKKKSLLRNDSPLRMIAPEAEYSISD